jgi:hypothetical protein
VKAVLLVIYLIHRIGAICTAWCLSVPTVGGELHSFLRVSFVVWPFTVTVFGVLVVFALRVLVQQAGSRLYGLRNGFPAKPRRRYEKWSQ